MKHAFLLFFLLFLVPTCLSAQQPDCRRRTIPVSVVDKNDMPIAGLTAEKIRGEFRGEPVRIVAAKWDSSPRRIVILLDMSASMSLPSVGRVAELLVWDALRSSPDETELALISFADEVTVQNGFSRDKPALMKLAREINVVDPKSVKRRTRLWDALDEAAKLLSPPRVGDAIYAITDGGENGSRIRFPAVEKALVSSGLRFYATSLLLFPEGFSDSDMVLGRPTEMWNLATKTGGSVIDLQQKDAYGREKAKFDLSPEGEKEILEGNRPIFSQMYAFYSLELELAKEVHKPRSWKLKMVSERGQFKGLKLHYPRTLVPCSAANDGQQAAPK